MEYYKIFLSLGCFTFDEARNYIGNERATAALLHSYVKRGYLKRAKRGLYVAVNPVNNEPIASKFQIACKAASGAYLSHHTAFEFYGYTNQMTYEVQVTSNARFRPFSLEGITYRWMSPHIPLGVDERGDGIRVTDPERSLLDNLNDFQKVTGFDELIQCLSVIPSLDEERMTLYLAAYDKQFLYQKVGFVLERYGEALRLSRSFFTHCAAHIGSSRRYLLDDVYAEDSVYHRKWQLVVPKRLLADTHEEEMDAEI